MNKKLSFLISLVVAIGCVFIIMSYVSSVKSKMEGEYQKVPTLVASKDIPKLAVLQENMVELIEVPKKYVQPGALKDVLDIRGKIAESPIKAGEAVTSTKIVMPNKKTGLSFQIEEGKRAITIAVNDVQAVAHLIKPFDHVDVMVIVNIQPPGVQENIQDKRIFMLYQDILVLATDQYMGTGVPSSTEKDELTDAIKYVDESEKRYKNLTLSVNPKEAMGLFLAQNFGELWVSLRPAYSSKNVALEPMNIEDVTGFKTPIKTTPRPAWMTLRNSAVNF